MILRALIVWCLSFSCANALPVRLKDLVNFDGVRQNSLIGYGLIIGLNGTGDSLRNAPFTEELLANTLERLGVNVSGEKMRPKNVAAVMVTAQLPPFARSGSKIDVTVSAIGDAKSLLGGTLIMTPLNAPDGEIYAVAQGTVLAAGVAAEGGAETVTMGVPTAGSIPAGAMVEREVDFNLNDLNRVRLALNNSDFTTAQRIEQAINRAFGRAVAIMLDSGTVEVDIDQTGAPTVAHALQRLENLSIEPEMRARVIVDQRSGTVVMGADVRISTVAVSQGGLTLRVSDEPIVVQPSPFAQGETVIVPRGSANIETPSEVALAEVRSGTNLSAVISGLNALGVSPQNMISILKGIKSAGALHAELIVE